MTVDVDKSGAGRDLKKEKNEKKEGKEDGEREEPQPPSPAAPAAEGARGKAPDDFDAILTNLGTGKFNILCYIAIAYWNTVLPYHTLAGAFLSPSVPYTCRAPPDALTPTLSLPTSAANRNSTVYATDEGTAELYDNSCSYLKENHVTGKVEEVACTEWDFDNSTFASTITSEFSLVCNYKYLRAAHQSIYMGGMLVGALFNGFLADRFGRWTMIAISTVSYTILALGSAWLPSMALLLPARFLLGSMHPTSLMTGYILVMEMTEMRRRSMMGMVTLNFWSVGTTFWGLWAYLERDWRFLQTYVSLFCPLFLPALLFLKESPRWLVVTGRHQKALSVLQLAAKYNGTKLPPTEDLLILMKKVQEQSTCSREEAAARASTPLTKRVMKQVTILFSTRKLALITVTMCITYLVVAMVFFGLTLGASSLGVNPFVYMIISGLVETPSVVTVFLVEYFGRKKTGVGTFSLCAVALLSQPLIPKSLMWLSITLVSIGKFFSSCAFGVLFLYSSELYPTEIRTQGMSAGMMSSRVGGFIAPFIISALETNHPWGISVVFGLASAVAAVSFWPLWETKDALLPDTVAQLEALDVHSKPGKEDAAKQGKTNGGEKITPC
ncbi:solute carrier family 22 member 7-like [Eriocheir sinensis]|uniref:solute carrier family 22 member 7-like n=1 Tax=Eriocheir sinensis TaxID=95602 RepID=UPI0021CA14AA|nr:solute carrier family 22 member 7-like [Eriocheir sinensis]